VIVCERLQQRFIDGETRPLTSEFDFSLYSRDNDGQAT
jgi:hypothetical protein